jgi:hypothetical protein
LCSCCVHAGAIGFGHARSLRLTPASPEELADALGFALRYSGRRRRRGDGGDRGQAPGGAPRVLRLRRHEKTADRRRHRDWTRGGRAVIRASRPVTTSRGGARIGLELSMCDSLSICVGRSSQSRPEFKSLDAQKTLFFKRLLDNPT